MHESAQGYHSSIQKGCFEFVDQSKVSYLVKSWCVRATHDLLGFNLAWLKLANEKLQMYIDIALTYLGKYP